MGLVGQLLLLLLECIRCQGRKGILIGHTKIVGCLRRFITVAVYAETELWVIKETTIDAWLTAGKAFIIIATTLEFIKGGLLCRIDRRLTLDPAVIAPVGALIPRLLLPLLCVQVVRALHIVV